MTAGNAWRLAAGRATGRRRRRVAFSYWPAAAAEVVVAIVLALALPRLEARYHWRVGISYDAGTAEATLGAIAGGMITLTGFVLTAVTLMVQTVQGQSSRLLGALYRSDKTALLFGTLIATFTFALLVLSEVHAGRVPDISVLLALVLVLACTALFLRLLVTFRSSLTVGGLTRSVGADMRKLVTMLYPEPFSPDAREQPPGGAGAQPSWTVRHAGEPGVFQSFDELAAVRLADKAGVSIRFVPAVGDFVVTGAVLAEGTGPAPSDRAVRALARIGRSRVLQHDPGYGLRMLADIAIRAVSPAVNDPTSAIQALDQVDDILTRLACRRLGDGQLRDSAGRVVVRYPARTWEAFLSLAVDEILLYGADSLQVTRRMRAMLEDLLAIAPEARSPAVAGKLAALGRTTARSFPDAEMAAQAAEPDRQGIGSARST